jgi:hypothetical protein
MNKILKNCLIYGLIIILIGSFIWAYKLVLRKDPKTCKEYVPYANHSHVGALVSIVKLTNKARCENSLYIIPLTLLIPIYFLVDIIIYLLIKFGFVYAGLGLWCIFP